MITWSTRPKSCYPPFRTNIVLVILSLRSNIEHSWAFNPLLLTFFQTYYSTTAVGMTIHQTSCELVFKKKNITLFDSPIQLNFLYIHYSISINTNKGNYIHNFFVSHYFLSHVLPSSVSLTQAMLKPTTAILTKYVQKKNSHIDRLMKFIFYLKQFLIFLIFQKKL